MTESTTRQHMPRAARSLSLVALLLTATLLVACGAWARSTHSAARPRVPSAPASAPARKASGPITEAQITSHSCEGAQLAARPAPIVDRPSSLGNAPAPLILALHGAGGNGQSMLGLSHFDALAARDGFEVISPSACDLSHPWAAGQDLYYLDGLIHAQVASGAVDPSRVYLAGFSAGGAEAWRMACMFSNDIAAIAVVSETMSTKIVQACAMRRPISQLLIVGTADGDRWTGLPGRLLSAVQEAAWWRNLNHCSSAIQQSQPIPSVTQMIWPSCASGTAVGLYELSGAAHVWPPYGVGAPQNYPTSQEVWNFLAAHRATPTSLSSPDAQLLGVRVSVSRGTRVVTASFRLDEPLAVSETLTARGKRAVRAHGDLASGSSVQLRLVLSRRVAAGRYRLTLALKDSFGRTATFSQTVAVKAPPRVRLRHG